ncbi:hypothetical protein Bca4012_072266 [Brassica carinata]
MPNGMLRLIVSKVGAASSTDYCNTVLTCKSLNFSLDDPLIAKTLNIAPLVERPHLVNRYEKTMESLLAANNLDAHYVKDELGEHLDIPEPAKCEDEGRVCRLIYEHAAITQLPPSKDQQSATNATMHTSCQIFFDMAIGLNPVTAAASGA